MSDPLGDAGWWVHPVEVRRYASTGAYGDAWDEPVTVTGFYDDKTVYSQGEVVATGRFAFPTGVPYIPVKSKVTLPAVFGGREARVVSVAVGDGGGQPTPDHQVIGVM